MFPRTRTVRDTSCNVCSSGSFFVPTLFYRYGRSERRGLIAHMSVWHPSQSELISTASLVSKSSVFIFLLNNYLTHGIEENDLFHFSPVLFCVPAYSWLWGALPVLVFAPFQEAHCDWLSSRERGTLGYFPVSQWDVWERATIQTPGQ